MRFAAGEAETAVRVSIPENCLSWEMSYAAVKERQLAG